LAAKLTFGIWHAGTCGIHAHSQIFGTEKLPWQNPAKNKKVGTIPAKVELWHNRAIFLVVPRHFFTSVFSLAFF